MSDDLASDQAGFAFWSKGELARISLIAGLVVYPLTVAAVDAPIKGAGQAERGATQAAAKPLNQPGRLRSVRVVDFDMAKFGMKALGDLDDAVR